MSSLLQLRCRFYNWRQRFPLTLHQTVRRLSYVVETCLGVRDSYRPSYCGAQTALGNVSLDAAIWLSSVNCPTFGYAVAWPARRAFCHRQPFTP